MNSMGSFAASLSSTHTLTETDLETGDKRLKVKLIVPLPPILARKATEALQSTRNAFDQFLYAGCIAIGKNPKDDIHFPWRMNPIDLEAAFNHKKCKIPAEFWDVIRREQPYPTDEGHAGGDDAIRELAKMANRKHTVGLATHGQISGVRYPDVHGGTVRHLSLPIPQWDPVKNEVVLVVYSGDVDIKTNYKIAFHIILDVAPPLNRIAAQVALSLLADRVERFAEALKTECVKITS